MRLTVRAHPGARREEVRVTASGVLEIWLREPARDGRANAGLERLLSEALGVRRSAVRIVRGTSSREKLVEVEGIEAMTLERLRHDTPD